MSRKTESIFTPEDYVPLTSFKQNDGGYNRISFSLNNELMDYIGNDFKISYKEKDDDKIYYTPPGEIKFKDGEVILETEKEAIFTLVSDKIKNSLPVVTHWDQSLNDDRGGFMAGGIDAPGTIEVQPANDLIVIDKPIYDQDPESPYVFKTDKYAFFEGELDGLYKRVPDYECYIGENYSVFKVSNLVITWLSNKLLVKTGFPLVSLNYPEDELYQNIPAFQILNNYIIGMEINKPSLATFILPPFWSDKHNKKYPVLFNGFYDNNENVYHDMGQGVLKVISDLYIEDGAQTIGIIWNGGGSVSSRTYQQSIYYNLSRVFEIAEIKLCADAHGIVAVGGSRGGNAALQAAGNPYGDSYSVPYAICYNPIIAFAEDINHLATTTCPMRYAVISEDTGYKYSWKKDWISPKTELTGSEQLLYNLCGSTDLKEIKNELGFFSPEFLGTLKRKGVNLLIHTGTHDAFVLKNDIIDFCEEMARYDIPFRFELGYRFGHHNATDPFGYARKCLRWLIEGKNEILEGCCHYIKGSGDDEIFGREVKPPIQPMFFEGPRVAVLGESIEINVVGEKGTAFELKLYKIDDITWKEKNEVIKISKGYMLFDGILPEKCVYFKNNISYSKKVFTIEEKVMPGDYIYELHFRSPGENEWKEIPYKNVPDEKRANYPILTVFEEFPKVSGHELLVHFNLNEMGWGLSQI